MPRSEDNRLQAALAERTTLRAILTAGVVTIVGIGLLFLSAALQSNGQQTVWSNLISNIGGLLVASVAVALLWELYGKRVFVEELLSKVQISHEVASAGITGVTHDFYTGIDWRILFTNSEKVDIFVAYGRGWRNANHANLLTLASRKGARIRVVLPDPDDERIVNDLAGRFNYSTEQVRGLILEAEEDFRKLRPATGQHCASISLWYLRSSPQFAFYRFDRVVVLSMYSHTHERVAVPTITCEQGGTLYNFARQEFAAMIDQEKGLARLVWEQNS